LIYYAIKWFTIAKNPFFKHIYYSGSTHRLGHDELALTVLPMISLLGLLVVILHDMEVVLDMDSMHRRVRDIRMVVMDMVSAFLVWMVWLGLCLFLKLFDQTSVIVSSLVNILKKDLAGWMTIYVLMGIATAGGIRIATWHDAHEDEEKDNEEVDHELTAHV